MNFFPNFPNMVLPNNMMMESPMAYMNDIINRFNEFDNRIKKLEQRIMRLESESNNNDYNNNEPDNSLYMI